MEVMLKKAKITNSILKQTKNSHISDIQKGRVLGFCQFEKFDFIVLHRPDINELSKFPMYRDFKIRPSQSYDDDKRNVVQVSFDFRYSEVFFELQNESLALDFLERLKVIKMNAKSLGQFYV